MKKVFAFFHNLFSSQIGQMAVTVATTAGIDKGAEFLEQGLEDFYAKNPKACSAMVVSLYVWVDTCLEDLAAKSNTDIDNKAIEAVKKEFEAFAKAKGFALSNLDAD